jgi:FAD binding domain
MLPGNPKPSDYKLMNCSPYKMHQRCADRFRVGKFLLAADAAHLCNPFGGLGLTGGMVDAGNLADCLIGIHKGLADESILDKYDEIRREMWHNVINPVSSENLQRMHPPNLDHVMEDPFFQQVVKAEKDPQVMATMVNVKFLFRDALISRGLWEYSMISRSTTGKPNRVIEYLNEEQCNSPIWRPYSIANFATGLIPTYIHFSGPGRSQGSS